MTGDAGVVLVTTAAIAVLFGIAIQAPALRAALHVFIGDASDARHVFPHWGIEHVASDALYCAWASRAAMPRTAAIVARDAPPPLVAVYHTDAAYARAAVTSITSLLRTLQPDSDAQFTIDVHYIGDDDEIATMRRVLVRRVLSLAPWVAVRVFPLEAHDRRGHAAAPEHLGENTAAAAAARARLDVLEMYAAAAQNDSAALIWMLDADTLVVPPSSLAPFSPTSWAQSVVGLGQPLGAAPMPDRAPCEFATGATLVRPANVARDLAVLRTVAGRAPLGDHDALNALYGSRLPGCTSARNAVLDWRMNVYGLGEQPPQRPRTMAEAAAQRDTTDTVLWRHVYADGEHAAVLQWSGPCKPWRYTENGRRCGGAELSYSLWNSDAAMRRWFAGQPAPTIVAALAALAVTTGAASLYAARVLWEVWM